MYRDASTIEPQISLSWLCYVSYRSMCAFLVTTLQHSLQVELARMAENKKQQLTRLEVAKAREEALAERFKVLIPSPFALAM